MMEERNNGVIEEEFDFENDEIIDISSRKSIYRQHSTTLSDMARDMPGMNRKERRLEARRIRKGMR